MLLYLARKAQIPTLIVEKAFIIISIKYLDFVDIFFKESTIVLSEYTKINTYAIALKEGK